MSGLKYLQGWIGVIGFTAFGNTVSCFLDFSFLSERIYTEVPNEVNALSGRLFGTWTLLSALVRVYCAFHIRNKQVYNLTIASFIVAFFHFITETFLYKTCTIETFGVFTPIIISGISVVWMLYGYRYLDPKTTEEERFSMDDIRLKSKKKR